VEDVCAVECLEGAECLVYKILAVVVAELLSSDDTVQVRLHELLDQIDL
jgi:hypothetical protein